MRQGIRPALCPRRGWYRRRCLPMADKRLPSFHSAASTVRTTTFATRGNSRRAAMDRTRGVREVAMMHGMQSDRQRRVVVDRQAACCCASRGPRSLPGDRTVAHRGDTSSRSMLARRYVGKRLQLRLAAAPAALVGRAASSATVQVGAGAPSTHGPLDPSNPGKPLAVPFEIHTPEAAKALFEEWKVDIGHFKFQSKNIELRRASPMYLPFFAFDSDMELSFDGALGWEQKDSKNKNYYWYENRIMVKLGCRWALDMTRYAGLSYRPDLVHRAMHPPLCAENAEYARVPKAAPSWEGLSAVLDRATPLRDEMLPDGCTVCPFEVGPSLCFEELSAEVLPPHKTYNTAAVTHLRRLDLTETFEYSGSRFADPKMGMRTTPCVDKTAADRYEASNLTVSGGLDTCRLDPSAGAVFVPMWVCDYVLKGKHYRAFVNGATGTVAGPPHVDTHTQAASGALTFGLMSPLCTWGLMSILFDYSTNKQGHRQDPLLFYVDNLSEIMFGTQIDGIPLPGVLHAAALVGAAAGGYMARQRALATNAEFDRMGSQLKGRAAKAKTHQDDPHWQAQAAQFPMKWQAE